MARIAIIGGSLGGLLAAKLLLRAGHDAFVLEKSSSSLDGRGAGIVTHQPLLDTLTECGLSLDASLGVQVQSRVALAADGSEIARENMPQILTSWSRLYAMLLDGFDPERYLMGVQIRCEDGRSFKADLAIASDGIRSGVRAQLAPAVQAQYAGYVAWRGVCEEAVLSKHCLSTLFGHFGFGLPEGEQIIGYPVAGAHNATEVGKRRYNFVWYRPADDAALAQLMTDADGQHYPLGIPPHKVAAKHIADARQAARALLAPQFAEIIEKTAQPFLQPIYDCASQRIAFGRIALMGDAAFVARPHVGMGVTKAAQDAQALAQCLATHGATSAALAAYEGLRLGPGQAVVQRGRDLGAYLEAHSFQGKNSHGSSSAHTLTRDARSVMLSTAVDLSVSV
jgi:2-polyprenyl-6-methoxyphenol hydroxylase-like FAD-dependent oxidoreductase